MKLGRKPSAEAVVAAVGLVAGVVTAAVAAAMVVAAVDGAGGTVVVAADAVETVAIAATAGKESRLSKSTDLQMARAYLNAA